MSSKVRWHLFAQICPNSLLFKFLDLKRNFIAIALLQKASEESQKPESRVKKNGFCRMYSKQQAYTKMTTTTMIKTDV